MKIVYIFIFMAVVLAGYSQEQIENGNFENWTTSQDPVNWNNTIDVGGFIIYTASRTTDAAQGNYAADLTTVNIYGNIIPGLIQLGELNVGDSIDVYGGDSIGVRPKGFSFFYKYSPADNDTAIIYSYLTRYDTLNHIVDTVAVTGFVIWDTVDTYKQMFLPYIYSDTDTTIVPDTINILFMSSSINNPKEGSELLVDSVNLVYTFYPYPTFAMKATDVTPQGFVANWFPGVYSQKYFLDVATDTSFNNYLSGYENLPVNDTESVFIPIDSTNITRYYYRVRVNYGDTAVSENSNIIEVTPPFATECLNATDITSNSFTAVWNSISFADSYMIDVAKDTDFIDIEGSYQDFNTGSDTSLTISDLTSNKYFYRVRVVYDRDTSNYSNVVSVTLLPNASVNIIQKPVLHIINNNVYLSNLKAFSNIQIYDMSGRLIKKAKVKSSEFSYNFAQKGVYIITIGGENYKILIK